MYRKIFLMDLISNYTKNIKSKVFRNKIIFENSSYLTLFQALSLVIYLTTYPYLKRILTLK